MSFVLWVDGPLLDDVFYCASTGLPFAYFRLDWCGQPYCIFECPAKYVLSPASRSFTVIYRTMLLVYFWKNFAHQGVCIFIMHLPEFCKRSLFHLGGYQGLQWVNIMYCCVSSLLKLLKGILGSNFVRFHYYHDTSNNQQTEPPTARVLMGLVKT